MKNKKEKLLALIKSNDIEAIKTLLSKHIEYVTLELCEPKSLLHYAAELGHLDLIQFIFEQIKPLFSKKVNLVDYRDAFGQTPLIWAAANGHEDTVQYLIKQGANLNLTNTKAKRYGAIHWACKNGHVKVLQCLIAGGADITLCTTDETRLLPIHVAARYGRLDIVKRLLDEMPESLEFTDAYSQTALLWAVAYKHKEVVILLTMLGARFSHLIVSDKTNAPESPPLNWLFDNEYYDVLGALILGCHTPKKQDTILSIITKTEVAMILMNAVPELAHVFRRNKRILALLDAAHNCHITKDHITWYKPLGRSPSFFGKLNTKTNALSLFKPVPREPLGEGVDSVVRLFEDEAGNQLAVKK